MYIEKNKLIVVEIHCCIYYVVWWCVTRLGTTLVELVLPKNTPYELPRALMLLVRIDLHRRLSIRLM